MYHNMLSRLFEQGAEDPDSAAHAELVELLALKVCCMTALFIAPLSRVANSSLELSVGHVPHDRNGRVRLGIFALRQCLGACLSTTMMTACVWEIKCKSCMHQAAAKD